MSIERSKLDLQQAAYLASLASTHCMQTLDVDNIKGQTDKVVREYALQLTRISAGLSQIVCLKDN